MHHVSKLHSVPYGYSLNVSLYLICETVGKNALKINYILEATPVVLI